MSNNQKRGPLVADKRYSKTAPVKKRATKRKPAKRKPSRGPIGWLVAAIMAALGLPNTLLGVDVICHSAVLQEDVTSLDLLRWTTQGPCRIVVTVIGGQGHVFGRGNQQFSPEVIRAVGLPAIDVVATKTKLEGLQRPYVIVDTGDQDLDQTLSGVHRIRTGYNDAVLMRWGTRS